MKGTDLKDQDQGIEKKTQDYLIKLEEVPGLKEVHIVELDELQHTLYSWMDTILSAVNDLGGVDNCCEQLKKLFSLSQAIDHKLSTNGSCLYFSAINKSLLPSDLKGSPVEFMRSEFEFFITRSIKFKNAARSEQAEFLMMLRKIFSRPEGQNLIIQLNKAVREKNCQLTVFPSDIFSVGPDNKKTKISPYLQKVSLEFVTVEHYTFGLNRFVASFEQSVIFQHAFIALAHELTHVLNYFTGTSRIGQILPTAFKHSLITRFHLDPLAGYEELSVISLNTVNENNFRREHGLKPRALVHPSLGSQFTLIEVTEEDRRELSQHLKESLTEEAHTTIYRPAQNYSPITLTISIKIPLPLQATIWSSRQTSTAITSQNTPCLIL